MRAMKLSSPLKRAILLALHHAWAHTSEHACEQQLVFLMLLKKFCPWSSLCNCTSGQSHDLIRLLPSMRADILAFVRAYHCTWQRDWIKFTYKFSCVILRALLLLLNMCVYFGSKSLCVWKIAWGKECVGKLAMVRIKGNAPRYFDIGEQLPYVYSTIKQTLINICPKH
jgi:hypothetical protein